MRAMRRSMKLYVVGAVVTAAALTTTACGPTEDKADSKTSPSASAPSTSAGAPSPSTSTPSTSASAPSTSGGATVSPSASAGGSGGWAYANRQTPPKGSICDHGGQGPYGKIQSVNFGGESPNTVVSIVLGSYECAQPGEASPVFTPNSATGAATDVLLDDSHLKVVVGGKIASQLGTKTPTANTFVKHLADMQDRGELNGRKAPEFYFRLDSPSGDVNVTPDDKTKIIYLYQIVDGS